MASTEEFISGLTWGAGLALAASAMLGILVKSNTFPALTQFFELASNTKNPST